MQPIRLKQEFIFYFGSRFFTIFFALNKKGPSSNGPFKCAYFFGSYFMRDCALNFLKFSKALK